MQDAIILQGPKTKFENLQGSKAYLTQCFQNWICVCFRPQTNISSTATNRCIIIASHQTILKVT